MKKQFFTLISYIISCFAGSFTYAQTSSKLTGNLIYDSAASLSKAEKAFDNSKETYFESESSVHAWVGYDLGEKYVITKVRWCPRKSTYKFDINIGSSNLLTTPSMGYSQLALFEGANTPDFSDAIPLYIVTSNSTESVFQEQVIEVSRGFQYVRYVGPHGSYGCVGELEFYGYMGDGTDDCFYRPTNLPLMVIHTNSGNDPVDKVHEEPGQAFLIYKSNKGNNKIIGDDCTIRCRGNNSRKYDKKPFRVKFANKIDMPNGGSKAKKWTLINNFGDKTLMRNSLAFDMSKRLEMEYTPYCQPVDVVLNGEYLGSYQLCDQLEVGKHRVNIDEIVDGSTEDGANTGGYFYEYDGNYKFKSLSEWNSSSAEDKALYDVGFYTDKTNPITIKSPDEDVMLQSHVDYLSHFINTAEKKIYKNSVEIKEYLDLESFARYFIVNEFTGNSDTFYELYQYKKRNDSKVYFGPCWDFDLAYCNDSRTLSYLEDANASGWTFQNGGSSIEKYRSCGAMLDYANALIADGNVLQALKENWAYVRANGSVNSSNLLAQVNMFEDSLSLSQKLNFTRWPILNTRINMSQEAYGSFSAEVNRLKTYIPNRLKWFDKTLSLQNFSSQLSISSATWSTICLPYAFQIPDGIECYSILGLTEEGDLDLEEVSSTRPNVPYLIHGDLGDYSISGYKVKASDGKKNGLLIGTTKDIYAPVGSFVLQQSVNGVGFYKVVEGKQPLVTANKAYLMLPTAQSFSPIRSFPLDETLCLDEYQSQFDVIMVYNLSGQLIMEIDIDNQSNIEQQIYNKAGNGIYILVSGNEKRKISISY